MLLLFGILIAVSLFNIYTNKSFFETSFTTCVSIAVAVGISYFLSQKQTDRRKQKEILLNLVSRIQNIVCSTEAYTVQRTTDPDSLTMRNRDINNAIHILENFGKRFDISTEVCFIREKFNEYEELIGNHINDLNYLQESKKELKRPLDLIDKKLFEIMLKIYD